MLEQPINLIPSTSLNFIEHVYVPIKPVSILFVQIAIPFDTFK
jgi:hypothetical protein